MKNFNTAVIGLVIFLLACENGFSRPPVQSLDPPMVEFEALTPIFEIRIVAGPFSGIFSVPFKDFVWNSTEKRYEYHLQESVSLQCSFDPQNPEIYYQGLLATISGVDVYFYDTVTPYELKYNYSISLGNVPVEWMYLSVHTVPAPVPQGLYRLSRIYSRVNFQESSFDSDHGLLMESGDYGDPQLHGLAYFRTSSGYTLGGVGLATCDTEGCNGGGWVNYPPIDDPNIPGLTDWIEILAESRAKPGDNYSFIQQFKIVPR